MKSFYRISAFAAIIAAIVSCARVEELSPIDYPAPESQELHEPITFTASHGPDSKTNINEDYSISWVAGDIVTVFDAAGNSESFTVEEDAEDFTFTSTGILGDGPYYAITGYGSSTPAFDKSAGKISVERASTDGSFGQAYMSAAKTENTHFYFRHVYGILKLSLASDDIKSVKFVTKGISSNNPSIGFGEDGTMDVDYGTTSDEIVINGLTGAGTYYLPAIPGTYSDGFSIYMYFKSQAGRIDSQGSFTLKREKLMNFGTLDGGTPASSAWELVTDASTLAAGDEIIITAADYDYALSTTQNSNNRGVASITKSEDKSTLFVESSDIVQTITLTAGSTDGSFGFYTGSGYLYAASSNKNYLRTKSSLDANGSWAVTIDNGVAAIVAQGSNSRNILRYNPNNGSPLFSCYSSNTQKDVSIYRKSNTPGSGPQMEDISAYLDLNECGLYVYDGGTDTVDPLYLYEAGRDQVAKGGNGKVYRLQSLSQGLLAGIVLPSTPSAGNSYLASTMLYGIDGYDNGNYDITFTVKKIQEGKVWLRETEGALVFIIPTE